MEESTRILHTHLIHGQIPLHIMNSLCLLKSVDDVSYRSTMRLIILHLGLSGGIDGLTHIQI